MELFLHLVRKNERLVYMDKLHYCLYLDQSSWPLIVSSATQINELDLSHITLSILSRR